MLIATKKEKNGEERRTKILEQFRSTYEQAGWKVEEAPKPTPKSKAAKVIAKGIDAEKAANVRGESKSDKNRLAEAIAATELGKTEPDKFDDGLFKEDEKPTGEGTAAPANDAAPEQLAPKEEKPKAAQPKSNAKAKK